MHHLLLALNIGDSLLAGPRIQEPCLKYKLQTKVMYMHIAHITLICQP